MLLNILSSFIYVLIASQLALRSRMFQQLSGGNRTWALIFIIHEARGSRLEVTYSPYLKHNVSSFALAIIVID